MKRNPLFIALWCSVIVAHAQQLPSVTVNNDLTVTYRVTAPNAKEVSLVESILTPEAGGPLTGRCPHKGHRREDSGGLLCAGHFLRWGIRSYGILPSNRAIRSFWTPMP